MANNITLIVYPVTDTEKAKEFYNTFFGTEPYVDSPYYIGYKVGELEIGLDPNATGGPISYIDVDDITASVQAMVDAGATVTQEPTDVAAGLLVAKLTEASGSVVGLRQQP